MPPTPRPRGTVRPAPEDVNAAIRRLMEQPATARRAEEYVRLLLLWAEATGADTTWITAA